MMLKSKTILEFGAIDQLEFAMNSLVDWQMFSEQRKPRVLAVIDRNAYQNSGAASRMDPIFQRYKVSYFFEFQPNPKLEDVHRGIELFRQDPPEIVLALGGGTAIDLAKLISALSQAADIQATVQGQQPTAPRRNALVAIPTTAGTGSEATQFAVVYLGNQKYSLDHSSLLPDLAIIDPGLMLNLPASITAATGLDALCQAIESIWSVSATEFSIDLAVDAIKLAMQHLPVAVNKPTEQSRIGMCQAAYWAGKAINITRTTACHALSYWLTSTYQVAHGVAVSLTLVPMLQYNSRVTDDDCMDPRGAASVRDRIQIILQAMQADSVDQACQRFQHLLAQMGCPTSLDQVGVRSQADIQRLVRSVNMQRMANNPRRATAEALCDLLVKHQSTPDSD